MCQTLCQAFNMDNLISYQSSLILQMKKLQQEEVEQAVQSPKYNSEE